MCIISFEKQNALININQTKIFSRHTRPNFQLIVYSMAIATNSAAAMILPIPIKANSGEDAVMFIDIQSFCDFDDNCSSSLKSTIFFNTLTGSCEREYVFIDEKLIRPPNSWLNRELAVHNVGDYEASYIPSMKDFNRLDKRFRIETEIWGKLPNYSDYGFVVFQLKTSSQHDKSSVIPPMAFEFPTAEQDRLFFPTVHVHGNSYHKSEEFDHVIFCQRESARAEFKFQRDLLKNKKPTPEREVGEYINKEDNTFKGYSWFSSSPAVVSDMIFDDDKIFRTIEEGILDPDKKLFGMKIQGKYINKDIFLGERYD